MQSNKINWNKWQEFRVQKMKKSNINEVLDNSSISINDLKIIEQINETKIPNEINGICIDIFTAEAISKVYNMLTESNKTIFHTLSMNDALALVNKLK